MKQFTITQDNTTITLTLKEISQRCAVPTERVLEFVECGVLDNERVQTGDTSTEVLFDAASLFKIKRLLRLQEDLHLNLEGAALAGDLLDEIDRLHRRIQHLEQQVEQLGVAGNGVAALLTSPMGCTYENT